MQNKSALFDEILRSRAYSVVTKAVIDGNEYAQGGGLVRAAVYGGLFSKNGPSVGGCVSREVQLIIRGGAVLSRTAKIELFSRVELGDQVSEWLPKGVFYIDTRSVDEVTGVTTLHGYDRLVFGEQIYAPEGDVGEWPRPADEVVNEIAGLLGLELDERTVIDPSVMVSYPNENTMREVLGYIAVAHAGNWTITDAGKLRLVPLWSIPEYVPEGDGVLVDQHGDAIVFGEVRILV